MLLSSPESSDDGGKVRCEGVGRKSVIKPVPRPICTADPTDARDSASWSHLLSLLPAQPALESHLS